MGYGMLKVENGDVSGAVCGFLEQMLRDGVVNAVLVPRALPGGDAFVQSLVKDPEMLKGAEPLAPTMAVQSARILSELTGVSGGGRVAAVLKPCEMRAVVELAKFLQIDLDNVVTVGVDCFGTVEVKDYAEMAEEDRSSLKQALSKGGTNGQVRISCSICEYPAPVGTDVTIGLLGSDGTKEVALIVGERLGKELAEKLSMELKDGAPSGREEAVREVADARRETRRKVFGEMKKQADSLEALLDTFSTCIRCHNCMNVCPICYCRECVFRSSVFRHEPGQFLAMAGKKGAIRVPTDTLMFHLTRMSHMATSCIGCGMCDSACPNGLPVSQLFSMMGEQLQQMFDYVPGRDPKEEPPVSVFKEKELEETAGEH